MDNYDKVGKEYSKTHEKPDKKYVMPETALKMLGPLKNKIVVDIGCGDGFFTKIFSKKAKKVYGLDNSKNQIKEANKNRPKNITYFNSDMIKFNYPKSDRIFVPFVLNYLKDEKELISFFKKLNNSLNKKGKITGIIDTPKSKTHNMKQMGVIKRMKDIREGEKIHIELYNNGEKIITLHSIYHTPEIIEQALKGAGFRRIKWHKPIISKKGLRDKGKKFWKGYIANCDLSYFSARK